MKIVYIKITNFKSVRELEINNIDNALILVGKNSTGKTSVIDAILLAAGLRPVNQREFLDSGKPIRVSIKIEFTDDDLRYYNSKGIIEKNHDYNKWLDAFKKALPSLENNIISFTCHINPDGSRRYDDDFNKNNENIIKIIPTIYHIDQARNLEALQNDVFSFYDKEAFQML